MLKFMTEVNGRLAFNSISDQQLDQVREVNRAVGMIAEIIQKNIARIIKEYFGEKISQREIEQITFVILETSKCRVTE